MTEALATQKIHFHLDERKVNGLTWEEYEALERAQEGDVKMFRLRPLLARFVVDEKGVAVEHSIALAQLGRIPMDQVPEVVTAFIESLKGSTVPKANGDSLPSPSAPSPVVVSESQAG